ncbi:radical SAM protein [Candidatus Parabeggiatoa sp. HSG14]|uniref:radical SAM/SPASM domain-containing protein n=1 Tax=Candidatus Parabeggiatoa sp. HSG14 TaxID=3055593 RepID=UPI0025A7D200|nr:radical SAM protein [Thiotrichales bacterium HSG14]
MITPKSYDILLLAINLTSCCNLACHHCYLDAGTLQQGNPNELTTTEICNLLNEIAQRSPETMIVLTGGEPLIRNDIEILIKQGTQLGLAMVVGTNGMLLTEKRVQSLKEAGILGVGISLDSLDPAYHDTFRGRQGSWKKTMIGIENCRRHHLSFQLHFSVTENNANELPAMIDFARSSGARVFNVFFLVCTGRGQFMSDISATRYEHILESLIEAQAQSQEMIIRPRCAPHYKRIAHQRQPKSLLNQISGMEGDGCIAGTHYCRITPTGGITACPYIPVEIGNIRQHPFWEIWDNEFKELRTPTLKGNCGDCEYQKLCGGCRARPLAAGGDLMDTDKLCTYKPQGNAIIQPLQPLNIKWSPDAEKRMTRVPAFLRKMVRKRAEAYVAELGEPLVTPKHLAVLSARRFGGKPTL